MSLFEVLNISKGNYAPLFESLSKYEIERNFTIDKKQLKSILNILPTNYSVVLEYFYVDKVFRSSYYNYYASKHFDINRFCVRLCFFKLSDIHIDDFYNSEKRFMLQESFMGFTVVQPISIGSIGRTYLNPHKINLGQCYVRTTIFNIVILGLLLEVETYPFSSQNSETMTCAETSLWTISEYFGTRYSNYRIYSPSEIGQIQSDIDFQKSMPSKGLSYIQSSHILKKIGFSPRVYYRYKSNENDDEIYEGGEFKRLFHYYIESGIPFIAGIKAQKGNTPIGHAVVCIGHGCKSEAKVAPSQLNDLYFVDSSKYYSDYVINDDNQLPFKIEKFNSPSLYTNAKFKYFIAPLYNRIFLEAKDAYTIVTNILKNVNYGIGKILTDKELNYSKSNPLVIRFFLTSARKYKAYRSENYPHIGLARVYTQIPFPKFIWVAELSIESEFQKENIFGEIILDATASRFSMESAIISIHYPGYIGYRTPDESIETLFTRLEINYPGLNGFYPVYVNNLVKVV